MLMLEDMTWVLTGWVILLSSLGFTITIGFSGALAMMVSSDDLCRKNARF
jgi:hypothetical protein